MRGRGREGGVGWRRNMEGRENIAVSISFICCGGEKLCMPG